MLVAMLTKLLMRFDPEQYRVHERAAGLATPFEHEYPGKAGLFWVRHEHFFERERIEIANFITRSLPAGCYQCPWGARRRARARLIREAKLFLGKILAGRQDFD